MNTWTRLIAQYLEIPLAKAVEVQDFIDRELNLDWSEASAREIEATAFYAYKIIRKEEAGK